MSGVFAFEKNQFMQEMDAIEMREVLNRKAIGVRMFTSAFRLEARRFDKFMHELASGRAGYGNTNFDWAGTIGISLGLALIDAAIAIFEVTGKIIGYLPHAIGLGLALVGMTAHMVFSRHRNSVKQQRYEDAARFVEDKEYYKNIDNMKIQIMERFATFLNHCSAREARDFARNIHRIIADAIVKRRVKEMDVLLSPEYMRLYQQQLPENQAKVKRSMMDVWRSLRDKIRDYCKKNENTMPKTSGMGFFAKSSQQESQPEPESLPRMSA